MDEVEQRTEEREIEAGAWVVDDRRGQHKGQRGVVTQCDRFGHVADPYWLAGVLWVDGSREHNINTCLLRDATEPEETR